MSSRRVPNFSSARWESRSTWTQGVSDRAQPGLAGRSGAG